MSQFTNHQPVTSFADIVWIQGSPDPATAFFLGADDQTPDKAWPLALRADIAAFEAKCAAANLGINCQFVGPLFDGEYRYAVPALGLECRFMSLANDPLWQHSKRGFPLPDATRAELEQITQSVPDLDGQLYIVHEVELKSGPSTVRSTWEELAPTPAQQTLTASAQLGRVAGQAVHLATLPYLGAVATLTVAAAVGVVAAAVSAVAIPMATVATVGAAGSLVALDPILFLARVAPGRPLIPGEIAAFYPLAKWIYT